MAMAQLPLKTRRHNLIFNPLSHRIRLQILIIPVPIPISIRVLALVDVRVRLTPFFSTVIGVLVVKLRPCSVFIFVIVILVNTG